MRKIDKAILIAAAAGGIVPNMVRISIALMQGTFEVPALSRALAYSLGMLLMASAGAFVAWIFDEKEKKKAFYMGMGLPALLQLTFTNLEAPKTPVEPTNAQASAWVSIAYAEPPRARAAVPAASRQLHLAVDPYRGGEKVTFFSKDRKQSSSVHIPSAQSTIPIPAFAAIAVVNYKKAASDPVPLEPSAVTSVSLQMKENAWGGFWNALGGAEAPVKISVQK